MLDQLNSLQEFIYYLWASSTTRSLTLFAGNKPRLKSFDITWGVRKKTRFCFQPFARKLTETLPVISIVSSGKICTQKVKFDWHLDKWIQQFILILNTILEVKLKKITECKVNDLEFWNPPCFKSSYQAKFYLVRYDINFITLRCQLNE